MESTHVSDYALDSEALEGFSVAEREIAERVLSVLHPRCRASTVRALTNRIEDRTGLCELELRSLDELPLIAVAMERAAREQRMIAVHLSDAIVDPRRAHLPALSKPPHRIDEASLRREVLAHLGQDHKILFTLGRGCLGNITGKQLQRIAARTDNLLFATTLGGHGMLDVPESHYVGLVGTLGTNAALTALREADCVVVLGARWPDVVLGINTNAELHMAVKERSAQVVLKEQDRSPLVSRYALHDAVAWLTAFADAIPEHHGGAFRRPEHVAVDDLRGGRIHPVVAALGEVVESLPAGEVAFELGIGCVSTFHGVYAGHFQRVPMALSHDGSMGELGYTLALCEPRFVFVQMGDGEARMSLSLYLSEAVQRARLGPREVTPDRAIIIWDNEDLHNTTAIDARTHGRAFFTHHIPVAWSRLAEMFPDAPALITGVRCETADKLREILQAGYTIQGVLMSCSCMLG